MNRHLVGTVEELRREGRKIVSIGGKEVGVFAVGDEFYAWRNVCPHNAAPVCKGRVGGTRLPSGVYEYRYGYDRQILRCPWHGWEFDLKTGVCLADPDEKLFGLPVEVEAGSVYVLTK